MAKAKTIDTRHYDVVRSPVITEISEVSKGWRHCASTPAATPHSSMLHTSAGLSGLFRLFRLFG